MESLQEENKQFLEALIKKSKDTANKILNNSPPTVIKPKTKSPPVAAKRIVSSFRTSDPSQARTLTLKQIKDTIEEIYNSKDRFDNHCRETNTPIETLSQHVQRFLNQKYGLRGLITEWDTAISKAVEKYSEKDVEVSLFGKQLRNECDEDFRNVQKQVKETVSELLRMHLKGKYPLKKNSDIKQMYHDRFSGFICEDEWIDIVRYMYNDADADILIQIIAEFIQDSELTSRNQQSARGRKGSAREQPREQDKKARGRLKFHDFVRILLEFQLRGHEKFLNSFIAMYKKVDEEGNGIITESQFRALVQNMRIQTTPEDVEKLLKIVDPYQNGNIIFSECVNAFTSDACRQGDESILQSLASREF